MAVKDAGGTKDGSCREEEVEEMEEMEVARIQRELAALWLQDGGIWQLYAHGAEGIEALLPSWSLDDLGASPSVDGGPTVACFDAYLAKFGEMVDDIEACLSASPEVSRGDGPKALLSEVPGAYLGDPVSFMLSEEANWGFAEAFGGAGATNLQGLVDAIDELLFREALKKREELVACQKTVEDLKKAVAGLAARVQEERAEVQGTFRDLGASSGALVLRRRRVNLGRVINDLERIVDAFEAFEAIRTVLDDANATDGEIEEVMMAFRSVREDVEDMVGRIGVIDGLLSSLVERHDSRVAQLMVDEYRERVELLKVSLRAETWRHTTDVADLRSIAGGIGGTVREEDGKVDAAGRAYGVVKAMVPLADVVAYVRDCATDKAREAASMAVDALRVFNGMTRQLVLGAAAMESAGLTSISVRNLAIAREQIELASWIASNVVTEALPAEFEPGIGLCVREMDAHADEIRAKIVSVAVALLLPQIKNAATALGSKNLLATVDVTDGLIPHFKDLVDGMVRDLRIIAKVSRGSFPAQDADTLLEEICVHLVTWLRDAGGRVSSLAQVESFRRHAFHLRECFSTVHPTTSIDEVLRHFEERHRNASS